MTQTKFSWLKRIVFSVAALAVLLLLVNAPAQANTNVLTGQSIAAQTGSGIDWRLVGDWLLNFLLEAVTFLVFGALSLWLFPRSFTHAAERARAHPFKSLGIGTVVVIVGYLAALLLFLLIAALWVGLLATRLNGLAGFVFGIGLSTWALAVAIFSLVVAFVSKLVVAYLIGKLILRKYPAQTFWRNFVILLLGVFIYLLVRSIPWIGLVIGAVVTLIGLGALWFALREHRISVKAVHPADEAPAQEISQPVASGDSLNQPDVTQDELQPADIEVDKTAASDETNKSI